MHSALPDAEPGPVKGGGHRCSCGGGGGGANGRVDLRIVTFQKTQTLLDSSLSTAISSIISKHPSAAICSGSVALFEVPEGE